VQNEKSQCFEFEALAPCVTVSGSVQNQSQYYTQFKNTKHHNQNRHPIKRHLDSQETA